MGEVLIIQQGSAAQATLKSVITRHFANAHVREAESRFAVESLILQHFSLVFYVCMNLKDLDMELVSDIRFVSGRTPLVIYSRFGQPEPVAIDLLKMGINGLLSVEASTEQHNMAIDAVMRGDSYIDANLKRNIVNALLPHLH